MGRNISLAVCAVLVGGCADTREDTNASLSGVTVADGGGGIDTGGDDSEDEGDDDEKLDLGDGTGTGNGGDGQPGIGTCAEAAEAESNQGCEFWAVDLPNAWAGIGGSPAPQDQQFAVAIANTVADIPANVSVFLGAGTDPVQFELFEMSGDSIQLFPENKLFFLLRVIQQGVRVGEAGFHQFAQVRHYRGNAGTAGDVQAVASGFR